jgi:hypothetical protein
MTVEESFVENLQRLFKEKLQKLQKARHVNFDKLGGRGNGF